MESRMIRPDGLTAWADLGPECQLELRLSYASDPDCLTGSCSLEDKLAHFSSWLAKRGVAFSEADLRRRG